MKKFLVMVLVLGMMLSGCDSSTTPSVDSTEQTAEVTSQSETKEEVLFESDAMKVSFIEVFEAEGVAGAGYLRLKVENKTDKTVTVYPKDAYVNDTSVTLGSGVPMTLLPGKNSQAPFIIFYSNLGITSKDEIQKIELKLTFDDENYDMIAETETMVIEFNK